MTVISKAQALSVARRAYGSAYAESLDGRLPDRIDLNDAGHARLLGELGLTLDALFDALGAEF